MKPFMITLFLLASCILNFSLAGCTGPCSCDWEGGQTFAVTAAYQDGNKLYLEVTVTGEPCCEKTWERKKIYLFDFTGYTTGDVTATSGTASSGNKLTVGEKDKMELTNPDFVLERNPELVQVSILTTSVKLLKISEKASGQMKGYAIIQAGSAIE